MMTRTMTDIEFMTFLLGNEWKPFCAKLKTDAVLTDTEQRAVEYLSQDECLVDDVIKEHMRNRNEANIS